MSKLIKYISTFTLTFILIFGLSKITLALPVAEKTHIPVVINILKGAGVTEPEARDAVKKASEILNNACFKLVVIDVNKDVEIGNKDGELTYNERKEARTKGGQELMDKTKHPNQKGIKIYFADKPVAGKGSTGVSVHKKEADGKEYGDPTIIVKKHGDAAATGQTIAHEISHVLTLGKGHKIDNSTKADNGGHIPKSKEGQFPDNVMRRTAGNYKKFTPAQVSKMKEDKYRHGKCTAQFKSAYPAEKYQQQYGAQTDDFSDQSLGAAGYFDLHQVIMQSLAQDENIGGTLALNDLLPDSGSIDATLGFLFNTDADSLTGISHKGFDGVEKEVAIHVSGDLSLGPLTIAGTIKDLIGGTELQLPTTPILGTDIELIDDAINGSDETIPISHSFYFDIPKSVLGFTATEIPIGVFTGDDFAVYDTMEMEFDLEKWLKDPTLMTFGDGVPTPGASYAFKVSGLKPNDPFNLFLNEDVVFSSILDNNGAFEGSFMFSDTLSNLEVYSLTAQDSTGEFAYSHTCPTPEPSTYLLLLLGLIGVIGIKKKI